MAECDAGVGVSPLSPLAGTENRRGGPTIGGTDPTTIPYA
jgi:hypothetical protein